MPIQINVPPIQDIKQVPFSLQEWIRNVSLLINSTGIFSVTSGGTGISSYSVGDMLYASATDTLAKLAIGSVNKMLRSTGTAPAWSSNTWPNTTNQGDILYASAANTISTLGIGSSGKFLNSSGTVPQWTAPGALTKTDDVNVTLTLGGAHATALLAAASITVGWAGTLGVTRGGTSLGSVARGDLLYASAANTITALSIGTTGKILTSDGTDASWQPPAAPVMAQTEVDFGSTLYQTEKTFTITDSNVTTSSKILAQIAGLAPTGKSVDEVLMEHFTFIPQPGTGQFDLLMKSHQGSVTGKFKVWYLVGT